MATMDVNALSATAGTAAASTAAAASKTMGKEAFLKLLITQLQYQDPMNPADSTEFTAQLAQFSSLEQLSNVNENLNTLKLYQASMNNSQAVSFIGKLKTTAQMIALLLLLYHDALFGLDCQWLGRWLLDIAAFLTLWSMLHYLHMAWKAMKHQPA